MFFRKQRFCSVILPDSLKEIEGAAFSGCGALESIELPIALQQIGDGSRYSEIVKLNKLGKKGITAGQKIKLQKK